MSDIVRLPVRRKGAFEFEHEVLHARVGAVEVLVARLVTTVGPEKWGVLIRSPGQPDAMPCSTECSDPEGFYMHLANLACVIEATLQQALVRVDDLCAENADLPKGTG